MKLKKKQGSAETFFLILSIVDWKSKSILAADGSPLETKKKRFASGATILFIIRYRPCATFFTRFSRDSSSPWYGGDGTSPVPGLAEHDLLEYDSASSVCPC